MMVPNDPFVTSDQRLAAALNCRGFKPYIIGSSYPQHPLLYGFNQAPKLDLTISNFYRGSLSVDPMEYYESLSYLDDIADKADEEDEDYVKPPF